MRVGGAEDLLRQDGGPVPHVRRSRALPVGGRGTIRVARRHELALHQLHGLLHAQKIRGSVHQVGDDIARSTAPNGGGTMPPRQESRTKISVATILAAIGPKAALATCHYALSELRPNACRVVTGGNRARPCRERTQLARIPVVPLRLRGYVHDYGDGNTGHGLSHFVKPAAHGGVFKSWAQAIRPSGRTTSIGLGGYPVVTLAEAGTMDSQARGA